MAEILTGGCHFVACRELSLEPPTLGGYEPEPICNIPQANYFGLIGLIYANKKYGRLATNVYKKMCARFDMRTMPLLVIKRLQDNQLLQAAGIWKHDRMN